MTAEVNVNNALKGAGLGLLGFAVFSLHDAVLKSIQDLPVFQVAFFAVLFSFVPFTFFLAFDGAERSMRPRLPRLVALRCLFTVCGLLSVFYAFGKLPLSEVYSLLFAAPILITLLAIPVLGERIRLLRWVAIVLGLVGVLVVLRPGSGTLTLDHLAGVAAAACVACNSIVTRKIGSREHSVTLIIYPMLATVIVTGIATAFVYVPMSGDIVLKLCAVGMLSVVGQTLMIQAYRSSEAQFVAPMQYSQMLWGLAYGAWLFNESADRTVLLGSLVIVCSGLLFIWRELVASVKQPVLRTRNVRIAGGPQTLSVETDLHSSSAFRDENSGSSVSMNASTLAGKKRDEV